MAHPVQIARQVELHVRVVAAEVKRHRHGLPLEHSVGDLVVHGVAVDIANWATVAVDAWAPEVHVHRDVHLHARLLVVVEAAPSSREVPAAMRRAPAADQVPLAAPVAGELAAQHPRPGRTMVVPPEVLAALRTAVARGQELLVDAARGRDGAVRRAHQDTRAPHIELVALLVGLAAHIHGALQPGTDHGRHDGGRHGESMGEIPFLIEAGSFPRRGGTRGGRGGSNWAGSAPPPGGAARRRAGNDLCG